MTQIRRRRKPTYQTQITARVSVTTKAAVEAKADLLELDVAEVIRRAIEAGLPQLVPPETETPGGNVQSAEVRLWWDGLTARERKRWGRRLGHIDDTEAFRLEAYQQAMKAEI